MERGSDKRMEQEGRWMSKPSIDIDVKLTVPYEMATVVKARMEDVKTRLREYGYELRGGARW